MLLINPLLFRWSKLEPREKQHYLLTNRRAWRAYKVLGSNKNAFSIFSLVFPGREINTNSLILVFRGVISVADPHWFQGESAIRDPAFLVNADPVPDPGF